MPDASSGHEAALDPLRLRDITRLAGYQFTGAPEGDSQDRERDVDVPLDEDLVREIKSAALRAAEAVREDFASPQRMYSDLYYETAGVESRSHQAQHQAVRDKCDELGADPGAYYRRDPESTADCDVRCLDEWPELNDAVNQRHPDDDHLSSLDDGALDALAAEELKATARECQPLDGEAGSPEVSHHDLDEDPPVADLNREMGVRILMPAQRPAAGRLRCPPGALPLDVAGTLLSPNDWRAPVLIYSEAQSRQLRPQRHAHREPAAVRTRQAE